MLPRHRKLQGLTEHNETVLCKKDREQTNPLDVEAQPHITHLSER